MTISGAPTIMTTEIRVVDIVVPSERMRKLRDDVVDSLAESIGERGLLQPIVVRPRGATNYWLVAGRHRLEAARQCGHAHIRAVVLDGLDADAALLAEIDENLIRGDLSPAERALHIGRRKELYERLHPTTKAGVAQGLGMVRAAIKRAGGQVGPKVDHFTEALAKATGHSRRKIKRDTTRAKRCVVLDDIVGTALDKGEEIDALAKLPEDEQRKLAARVKAGEKVNVKVAVMKERRWRRERELAAATASASKALGTKLYGCIYADPSWRYDNVPMGDVARQNEQHYPSMALDDIKALAVPAADNCVLFLWATVPLLPEAIEVMKAWGFTYKSSSTWVKDKAGTGYWVRGIVEHLLIGRRGEVPSPAPGDQFPGVVEAPRRRHSEKPEIFAERIERLFPNVPKLEMFARKARPGWDVWGNEAPAAMEAAQ
jgi:ParB/RepB/Spo0J family partition protein